VVAACANGLEWSRFSVSLGRRIHKKAVDRNRERRLVKEAFRLSREDLPRGFDFLVLAARPAIRLKLETTRSELVRLANKAAARQREKLAAAPPPKSPR
jgi:ribonuclease P protein component